MVYKLKTQKQVIFSENINKIKGIQLDFEQADNESYKQAIKEIKKTVIPDFVNSLSKLKKLARRRVFYLKQWAIY